jgi:NAD(P)-dependent dehydrogenase (short-subunit alcohol dehydrogenase family)
MCASCPGCTLPARRHGSTQGPTLPSKSTAPHPLQASQLAILAADTLLPATCHHHPDTLLPATCHHHAAGKGVIGPLEHMPIEELADVMDVNLLGVVRVTQAFLPLLRQGGCRGRHTGTWVQSTPCMATCAPPAVACMAWASQRGLACILACIRPVRVGALLACILAARLACILAALARSSAHHWHHNW